MLFTQGMVKDRKHNSMLLPASKLKKMLHAYDLYGSQPGSRCGFRTPHKHL